MATDIDDTEWQSLDKVQQKLALYIAKQKEYNKSYKLRLALETQSQRVRRKEEDSLMKQRQLMGAITKTMASSGVVGAGFNLMQGLGGLRIQDAQRLKQLKNTKNLTPDEKSEMSSLQSRSGKIGGVFSKLDAIFEKNFGEGSKWNDMMGGHGKEAATMVTLAGIGGGLALGKMIIDSSPAFQQLLKIMNFGIMLILRPIGDFFAFLFRPILILLLRKFIIPFYQTVYPWFMKNGKIIGDTVAALADTGDVIVKGITESGKILASDLTAAIKPATTVAKDAKVNPLAKVLEKIIPKVVPAAASKGGAMAGLASMGLGTAPKENVLAKIAKPLQKALVPIVKLTEAPAKLVGTAVKGLANVAGSMTKTSVNVTKGLANAGTGGMAGKAAAKITKPVSNLMANAAVKTGAKLAAKTASRFIPVVGQALLAVDALGSTIQAISPETYTGINTGIRAGAGALGIPDWLTEGALDFVGFGEKSTAQQVGDLIGMGGSAIGITGGGNSVTNSRGRNKKADQQNWAGGIIREPIFGVGRSGRTYSFGEKGAEEISPLGSSSGTTINVTVNGSIYSDKDMLNFQRTIMRAIETSTTRRAKL